MTAPVSFEIRPAHFIATFFEADFTPGSRDPQVHPSRTSRCPPELFHRPIGDPRRTDPVAVPNQSRATRVILRSL
jgi:hypothetical protein